MNPVRWRYLSLVFLIISASFLVATLTLPQVKSLQDVTYHGPSVSYFNATNALSGYYIPPVEGGTRVNVTFSNFVPGKVQISIFPTQAGNIAPVPGEVPVFDKTLVTNITIRFVAKDNQPYGIFVISYDNTTFLLRIRGIYSPFFWLGGYTSIGVIATFASGVLLYYYGFTSRRWIREEKAIHEARGGDT